MKIPWEHYRNRHLWEVIKLADRSTNLLNAFWRRKYVPSPTAQRKSDKNCQFVRPFLWQIRAILWQGGVSAILLWKNVASIFLPLKHQKKRQWYCQEQHWVLAGLCLWQWGCFSAAFHPQDDASLISLSWGWRGRIERFRKVSKTECWRELGVFSSREDPALLLNHLELLCSDRHCRGCPQQGDHKGPWESPVELHPCDSAWP